MPVPIELIELRARLETAGMVVVQEPDHITVRLPFFCSVHVHFEDGRLRTEAFFGVVPRVRSTMFRLGAATLLTLGLARAGLAYFAGMAVFTVMVGIYDVIRWTLTEQTITRIQLLSQLVPSIVSASDARFLAATTSVPGMPSRQADPVEAKRPGA